MSAREAHMKKCKNIYEETIQFFNSKVLDKYPPIVNFNFILLLGPVYAENDEGIGRSWKWSQNSSFEFFGENV